MSNQNKFNYSNGMILKNGYSQYNLSERHSIQQLHNFKLPLQLNRLSSTSTRSPSLRQNLHSNQQSNIKNEFNTSRLITDQQKLQQYRKLQASTPTQTCLNRGGVNDTHRQHITSLQSFHKNCRNEFNIDAILREDRDRRQKMFLLEEKFKQTTTELGRLREDRENMKKQIYHLWKQCHRYNKALSKQINLNEQSLLNHQNKEDLLERELKYLRKQNAMYKAQRNVENSNVYCNDANQHKGYEIYISELSKKYRECRLERDALQATMRHKFDFDLRDQKLCRLKRRSVKNSSSNDKNDVDYRNNHLLMHRGYKIENNFNKSSNTTNFVKITNDFDRLLHVSTASSISSSLNHSTSKYVHQTPSIIQAQSYNTSNTTRNLSTCSSAFNDYSGQNDGWEFPSPTLEENNIMNQKQTSCINTQIQKDNSTSILSRSISDYTLNNKKESNRSRNMDLGPIGPTSSLNRNQQLNKQRNNNIKAYNSIKNIYTDTAKKIQQNRFNFNSPTFPLNDGKQVQEPQQLFELFPSNRFDYLMMGFGTYPQNYSSESVAKSTPSDDLWFNMNDHASSIGNQRRRRSNSFPNKDITD